MTHHLHVGLVTQWYPPEPAPLPASLAHGLQTRGHHVAVVTGIPNYPSGQVPPGYSASRGRTEVLGGVTVHRAPLYPSHNRSAAGRIANYLSFAASSTVVARARVRRPDVWLTYSSPITASAAAAANGWRSEPNCLLLQDLWPDSMFDSGMVSGNSRLSRSVRLACNAIYRQATRVGIISPSMKQILVDRGVSAQRICYTPNWTADELPIVLGNGRSARTALGLPDRLTFLYAGNLGSLQNLRPLVDAFSQVPDAQLVLLGAGVERASLLEEANRLNATNVIFRGPVPAHEVRDYVEAADVQVVSLADSPLLRATMPSKVQAALASGRPVLAHAAGDVAQLVSAGGAGLTARPGDIAEIVATVRQFLELTPHQRGAMGSAARAAYQRTFTLQAGVDRVEAMLYEAVEEHSVRRRAHKEGQAS